MHVLPSGVMASGSELDKCIDLIRYEMISAVIVLAGNAGARFHRIGCGVVSELRAKLLELHTATFSSAALLVCRGNAQSVIEAGRGVSTPVARA